MPDGAHWLWVDESSGTLSAESCPGAVQIPFVEGSGPLEMSPCLAQSRHEEKESFWRKIFGKKN
jgi:penicillin-binding protein 1B